MHQIWKYGAEKRQNDADYFVGQLIDDFEIVGLDIPFDDLILQVRQLVIVLLNNGLQ